jgi:hypothetical protein
MKTVSGFNLERSEMNEFPVWLNYDDIRGLVSLTTGGTFTAK